ncbi:MAG TPA: helix-turn-helix transcriptional regulator [Mycobacterium sp.]|nr:helix-turn-helix transcriptional regulator [Mycobacterium sp.]
MLRIVMPRSGGPRPAYHIDDAWRARIRRKLDAKGWTQADLARRINSSPSVISDLLNGVKDQSPYVPAIHMALGLTPPLPPLVSEDLEELMGIWEDLDDVSRGRLLERARLLGDSRKKPDER